MPLSVEVKEVAFVPNPVPDLAVKASLVPQREEEFDLCSRLHSLFPPTLQVETTQCHVSSNSTSEGEGITRTGGGSCMQLVVQKHQLK